MDDASNDQTIGRTNVAPRTAAPAVQPTAVAQQTPCSRPTAAVERRQTSAGSGGGPFEWPTNASHYQLINRVGQGAFASVWKARIIDSSKGEDDDGVQCAIKIMDLEHVNINISGELLLRERRGLYYVGAAVNTEVMKSFFPRLIDRCRR
jgi:serine/threonine protein kinase